jgi:hypothetical protein
VRDRESEDEMSKPAWMKSTATLLAVAALCTVVAGCASDIGSSTPGVTQQPGDGPTMRYYGGPKYPMWPSQ